MKQVIPSERIENRIYSVRGKKVMLDLHLAELYGVPTGHLKRAVHRNSDRFPPDFVFALSAEELEDFQSEIVSEGRGGTRYLPLVFTEQGVAMLSSVLRSPRAVQVNIAIMRAFVKMRELMVGYKELAGKIAELEHKYDRHDEQIKLVFDALRGLMQPPPAAKKKFGFRNSRDDNGGTVTKARKQ